MTAATKKKTYVLLMSTHFMKDHPRAGDPTDFEDKILSRQKIHTIRSNYDYWDPIVKSVNAGEGILSVRKWTGKPYRSKQEEITQFDEVGIQKVNTHSNGWMFINGGVLTRPDVAQNDGLGVHDFIDWFQDKHPFNGAIIHFTNFRY